MTEQSSGQSSEQGIEARIADRVGAQRDSIRADLERLARIPSVSVPTFDQSHVEASAELVADLLRASGMPEVEILRVGPPQAPVAGAPAVVARRPAPPGAPTVLLYAHHDVQPPGSEDGWTTPAFEPTERDGRLFGRGCADDKAGICVHLAALRALGDDLGVGVTVFVEGEEEIGSPSFEAFLQTYHDRLAADVIVIADSTNWQVGVPALTTSLRGLVDGEIRVSTLDHALHSGMFGGAVPDATTALIKLLATFWDDDGAVAVENLPTGTPAPDGVAQYTEAEVRADAAMLDGARLVGRGSLAERLWSGPALSVLATDLPGLGQASNTLAASATVKFSLRVPPGAEPAACLEAIAEHTRRHVPWGASVEVLPGETGSPWTGDVANEVYAVARRSLERAWGTPPVYMGVGGSIPFIAALQKVYPEAVVLVTGVEDPDSRAHGHDESLHLGEFERACVAEALLLAGLAGTR